MGTQYSASSSSQGGKGGPKGGRKAAPKNLAETLPTPTAQRVVPMIDPALKAKYEKIEANKGKPKGERVSVH